MSEAIKKEKNLNISYNDNLIDYEKIKYLESNGFSLDISKERVRIIANINLKSELFFSEFILLRILIL